MTSTNDMPAMTTLAPLIDQLQALAEEHVPLPQATKITLWDDGDYDILIYHNHAHNKKEGLIYDNDTGVVRWRRAKNPYWEKDHDAEGPGMAYDRAFEELEEEELTTIEPPV